MEHTQITERVEELPSHQPTHQPPPPAAALQPQRLDAPIPVPIPVPGDYDDVENRAKRYTVLCPDRVEL